MDRVLTSEERRRFHAYHSRIASFVQKIICAERIEIVNHIAGTQRIEFYPHRFESTVDFYIQDFRNDLLSETETAYEEALYQSIVSQSGFNLLVLVGGLGTGKSTAVRYLEHLIEQRRDSILSSYPCKCAICMRRPIKIDCTNIRRNSELDQIYCNIFRSIRFTIYNRLMDEWLARSGISQEQVNKIDFEYKVLRRLLISNDLSEWADVERPTFFPVNLHCQELVLEGRLLDSIMTIGDVEGLVRKYKNTVERLADPLISNTVDPERALDFTSLLLGFYLSRCSVDSPNNLLIIDNVDQLPTEYIESLVYYVHDLASRNEGVRVLFPLRPSSIMPHGFIRDVGYMYHYGPDCFEMILDRLRRSVLMRPYAELSGDSGGRPGGIFSGKPSSEEVHVFILTIYLYSLILTAGCPGAKSHNLGEIRPAVHPDHQWLKNVQVSPRTLEKVSETLSALVGTCGRYATAQLQRYIWNMYSDPTILMEALALGLPGGAVSHLRLPYNILIGTILGDWNRQNTKSRLANLYRATKTVENPGWPSLAKLRILALLGARERLKVGKILEELAQFGIPAERGIEALNYLSDKQRLLLWFSRNSELKLKSSDLDQYAVISEHGLSYLYHVVGDFEYIWFCARDIPPVMVQLSEWSFSDRLGEYLRLLSAVGETEWKQLAFSRCSEKTVIKRTDNIDKGELFILWILISSLERALGSSEAMLSTSLISDAERIEVVGLVGSICNFILSWVERYKMVFGGNGYLVRYRKTIERSEPLLRRFLHRGLVDENEQLQVELVLEAWSEQPSQEELEWYDHVVSSPPREDFVTRIAKIGRGAIPVVKQFAEAMDKMEAGRISVWSFVKNRAALGELLGKRLPAFTEVSRKVGFLAEQAGEIYGLLSGTAATGTKSIEWFAEERRWLREMSDALEENRFETPSLCDVDDMDERKKKFNNIMSIFSRIARRLGAERTEHLDVLWQ
jgi:hypothetical protein